MFRAHTLAGQSEGEHVPPRNAGGGPERELSRNGLKQTDGGRRHVCTEKKQQ